jgi:hypothetical protein
MNPTNPSPRRRLRAMPSPEALETRSLLTGGAGNTFALVPGTIAQAGGSAALRFTIDPAHLSRPSGRPVVGIDITAQDKSTIDPRIVSVTEARPASAQSSGGAAGSRAPALRLARGIHSSAVLVTMAGRHGQAQPTASYALNISAQHKTSGAFLVGYYLPGDADGNGVVEQTDVDATRKALGTRVDQTTYNFDTDANRDGRITGADVALARKNLGARTDVTPVVTADLDPASVATNRVVTVPTAHFSGTATPGSTITYADVAQRTPATTTTADASGNYSLNLALAPGTNTFLVTVTDPFGQTISGQIAPVTYRITT